MLARSWRKEQEKGCGRACCTWQMCVSVQGPGWQGTKVRCLYREGLLGCSSAGLYLLAGRVYLCLSYAEVF